MLIYGHTMERGILLQGHVPKIFREIALFLQLAILQRAGLTQQTTCFYLVERIRQITLMICGFLAEFGGSYLQMIQFQLVVALQFGTIRSPT